jgi:Vacuolar sorting-associated protein 13, N-terminal
VRVRTSDRTLPGPISCSADVLPFSFTFNLRPNQYLQYQRLKSAVKSQQRFDTMPRQRPFSSPIENPRAWWKYAIACVTSRPNYRPWQDVKSIGQCRRRYIELVIKKNVERSGGMGFHAGLSAKHSAELLVMEDSLPIEALLAFHLVALRRVHESQQRSSTPRISLSADLPLGGSCTKTKSKNSSGRFRILSRKKKAHGQSHDHDTEVTPASIASLSRTSQDLFEDQSAVTTMSLLQAMTLRLGKKVWIVDWKLYDAAICTVFVRERNDTPKLKFSLRASGNLRSFGLGKRDFAFDITQCDMTHDKDVVLFVGRGENEAISEDRVQSTESYSSDADTEQKNLPTILLHGSSGPDLSTPSSFLDLPPRGTVCRVVAGKDQNTFKLSISAHPATLVWTPALSDSISEFSADQTFDMQVDLTQHIRNAATPLARKAQLALLSPASLSFHMNIEAPKIWVPLHSNNSEGSLFLDAGTLRMSNSKEEGDTEVHWKVEARDIGANFLRGLNSARFLREPFLYGRTNGIASTSRGETTVVRPFSIDASSQILRDLNRTDNVPFADPIRNVEVTVSPVCLNLVDAEMLARFLGKLYARGLHRVRRRVLLIERNPKARVAAPLLDVDPRASVEDFRRSDLPRILTVNMEKVEIALEGHSKHLTSSDERSLASLDTALQEYAPPTRAYLAEVFQISLKRSTLGHTEITRLSITDATIVRLRDVSSYTPLMFRLNEVNSEYCILVRSSEQRAEGQTHPVSEENQENRAHVFRAALLHNRVAHLDEVEVDIDSVVLRVTPTTLKDCAKAFRRIMEITQLVTKEMERKVHEEGRKARRRCK